MFKSSRMRFGGILLLLSLPVILSAGWSDTLSQDGLKVDSTMLFLQGTTYNRMLDRAIYYQGRADEMNRLAVEWRKEAQRMDDPIPRGQLQKRIIAHEDSADIYTQLANDHFMYLSENMPEVVLPEPPRPFLVKDTVLNGITVYNYKLNGEFIALLGEIREPGHTATPEPVSGTVEEKAPEKVTLPVRDESAGEVNSPESPERMVPVSAPAPAASFAVYDQSPYSEERPFEKDFTVPQGVFYRIQLAVFKRILPPDHFKGLSPITTEYIPERELTRYFAGKFTKIDDANRSLVKVRSLGYPDAFIIGYYNGKRASFSKLKALEE